MSWPWSCMSQVLRTSDICPKQTRTAIPVSFDIYIIYRADYLTNVILLVVVPAFVVLLSQINVASVMFIFLFSFFLFYISSLPYSSRFTVCFPFLSVLWPFILNWPSGFRHIDSNKSC